MRSQRYGGPVAQCNLLPGHSDCKNQIDKNKCPGLEKKECVGRTGMCGANNIQALKWMDAQKK